MPFFRCCHCSFGLVNLGSSRNFRLLSVWVSNNKGVLLFIPLAVTGACSSSESERMQSVCEWGMALGFPRVTAGIITALFAFLCSNGRFNHHQTRSHPYCESIQSKSWCLFYRRIWAKVITQRCYSNGLQFDIFKFILNPLIIWTIFLTTL